MAVSPIPAGYHTITPYLTVPDLRAEVDFAVRAFGAEVKDMHESEVGGHAAIRVGDSMLMLGRAMDGWPPVPSMLYVYLPDCDATYKQALAAGAKSLQEPRDEFYGDRNAGVESPGGIKWWLATHVEDVSKEEIDRRMKERHTV